MTTTCQQCGETFDQVVLHWRLSGSCDHPEFDQRQKEILKGLAMGDGSIAESRHHGDARMTINSTNETWLRWLRAQFGALATDVRLSQDGDKVGENARQYPEFDSSGGDWEYNDVYRVSIRAHPFITQMRERWYPNDEIQYPADLHLTPDATTVWYCSDGSLSWSDREHAHAAFGTHNEADRPEFLLDLFREHGFDPSWSEPLIRFTTEETRQLLGWMGVAPAGHEYKWAAASRDRYDELKGVITA